MGSSEVFVIPFSIARLTAIKMFNLRILARRIQTGGGEKKNIIIIAVGG